MHHVGSVITRTYPKPGERCRNRHRRSDGLFACGAGPSSCTGKGGSLAEGHGAVPDHVARAGPGQAARGRAKQRGTAETSMHHACSADPCAGDTNPAPARLCAETGARGAAPCEGAAVPGGTVAPGSRRPCGSAHGFCSSQRFCPACLDARTAVGNACAFCPRGAAARHGARQAWCASAAIDRGQSSVARGAGVR